MNRKQFIDTVFRYSLLAGVFALIAMLFRKNKIVLTTDLCSGSEQCKKCNKISACTAPNAIQYKTYGSER